LGEITVIPVKGIAFSEKNSYNFHLKKTTGSHNHVI